MDIQQLIDELPEDDSVSTLPLETGPLETGNSSLAPCCEKCEAELSGNGSLVCQQCGWYASIGTFVEIDKSWEVASNPELATEADAGPAPSAQLPTWAWILGGCVLGVIVESLAARLLTSEGSGLRTIWSLTQLVFGFLAFGVCHTYCFLKVMKNEADTKLLDYLLRPINTWSVIFRGLPERGWVCYVGLSGLTAVMMSVLVIGGIPYERLLDWGVKEKPKTNLMGALMDQALGNAKEDDNNLEEAIGDFAGKAELDDKKKKDAKKARKKEDCIIIGYMANRAGKIQTLFLAAKHHSKLSYAGSVRITGLPEEDLQELTTKLVAGKTLKSFIRLSIDGATWVKPKHLVRVSYKRKGKQGGLFGAKLVDVLGEVSLGGK